MLTDNKQSGVQVDLTQAETILCEKCSNGLFIPSFFLKKISALVSPTGQDMMVPQPVFKCDDCGYINRSQFGLDEEE